MPEHGNQVPSGIPAAAEFFVALGALTCFYCIIAELCYIIFTGNEKFKNASEVLICLVSVVIILLIIIIIISPICTIAQLQKCESCTAK